MNDYLTTQQAADYLHLTRRYIYHLVKIGKLSSSKPFGKLYFSKAELDEYLKPSKKQIISESCTNV